MNLRALHREPEFVDQEEGVETAETGDIEVL